MSIKILILDEQERTYYGGAMSEMSYADLVVRRKLQYTYEIVKDRHGDGQLWVDGLPKQPKA